MSEPIPTTKTFFKAVDASHFFRTMELTPIEIPELETDDGSVAIVYGKPISGKAALALGRSKEEEMELRLSRIVGQSIFNAEGERIFTDDQSEDLAGLISAPVFNRLASGVGAINKVKEGQQTAGGEDGEDGGVPLESPEKKD